MMKRLGFTLAEVLITLGIIGVVAAMTIPSLMNKTGGAEFKAGFKKAVSVLNQAITMHVAINGSDFSTLSSGAGEDSVYNMFTSRFTILKTGDNASVGGAFGTANITTTYTLFFNDGMAVTFPTAANNCSTKGATNCRVLIDVNGIKKPNVLTTKNTDTSTGVIKDQFVVDIFNQQVLPHDTKANYVLYN